MESNTKKTIKAVLIFVFISVILTQFLSAWTGLNIVDPLLDKFGTKEITIEPINFPLTKENKTFIRVNLENSGLGKIKELNVEYNLKCEQDSYKKAEIHKPSLSKGEDDYFEFEAKLNLDCSLMSNPSQIRFYEDKNGQCYVDILQNISNMCSYCKLEIKAYDKYSNLATLDYWYPFFEDGFNITGELAEGNSCLYYKDYLKKEDLTFIPERTVKLTFLDPKIGCLRGDISKEWCEENEKSRND